MQVEEILEFFNSEHTEKEKEKFKNKMLEHNDDSHVLNFVKKIQELVEGNNPESLEELLHENIPMLSTSSRVLCVTAVRNTCNHFIIYAAISGYNEIVDVLKSAQLTPQVVQYQGLSPEYIQAADELISRCPDMSM